jgi:hypothetical protein
MNDVPVSALWEGVALEGSVPALGVVVAVGFVDDESTSVVNAEGIIEEVFDVFDVPGIVNVVVVWC